MITEGMDLAFFLLSLKTALTTLTVGSVIAAAAGNPLSTLLGCAVPETIMPSVGAEFNLTELLLNLATVASTTAANTPTLKVSAEEVVY